MKNLDVSLDLRGTPEKILFHTGFLKGQGVPLHRNGAGHLTLNVKDICEKTRASAHKGWRLNATSSFPATADTPEPASLPNVLPPIAAEPVQPPPATEKKYTDCRQSSLSQERSLFVPNAVPPKMFLFIRFFLPEVSWVCYSPGLFVASGLLEFSEI